MKAIVIENHPADSRVKIKDDGICQSLTSRMGTGGGNVPLILQINESDFDRQMESDMSRRSDVDSPNIRGNRRR